MPIGIQNNDGKDPFESFVDRINEPREVIQEPSPVPDVTESQTAPDMDEPKEIDPVLEQKKMDIAMIPAETIVDVIDTTAVSLNSYIAQEPVEGATETEKQSLQKAFANYLRETDVDISPGKLCLILVLMIYAPKVLQAFQIRKKNIENEALRAENEQLRAQLQQNNKSGNNEVPGL
jgi:hypothetical protein